MPRAVHMLQRAKFQPQVVRALSEAFDAEWAAIEGHFDGWQKPAVEAARTSLAKIALHLAKTGTTEPEALREKMHQIMKRSHAALACRPPG